MNRCRHWLHHLHFVQHESDMCAKGQLPMTWDVQDDSKLGGSSKTMLMEKMSANHVA
jgi:hypothetical protein